VPQLPAPAFADRESSGDGDIPAAAKEHLRSGLRDRHACAPADSQTARRRTLTGVMTVTSQGTVTGVTFEDDAGPIAFTGLSLSPSPDWLKPKGWNLLRVTVRGAGVAAEEVKARFVRPHCLQEHVPAGPRGAGHADLPSDQPDGPCPARLEHHLA
jgi:hypothetical protein